MTTACVATHPVRLSSRLLQAERGSAWGSQTQAEGQSNPQQRELQRFDQKLPEPRSSPKYAAQQLPGRPHSLSSHEASAAALANPDHSGEALRGDVNMSRNALNAVERHRRLNGKRPHEL